MNWEIHNNDENILLQIATSFEKMKKQTNKQTNFANNFWYIISVYVVKQYYYVKRHRLTSLYVLLKILVVKKLKKQRVITANIPYQNQCDDMVTQHTMPTSFLILYTIHVLTPYIASVSSLHPIVLRCIISVNITFNKVN